MNCCDNIKNIGCANACGTVTIGATSVTGNYVLKFDAGAGPLALITVAVTAPADLEYTIDGSALQVGYSYTVSVTDPNGAEFTVTEGEETYDCWKFTIDNTITV